MPPTGSPSRRSTARTPYRRGWSAQSCRAPTTAFIDAVKRRTGSWSTTCEPPRTGRPPCRTVPPWSLRWAASDALHGVLIVGYQAGRRHPTTTTRHCCPASPTRPRSPWNAPGRRRSASCWWCWRTASGSPGICTTWSSSGCSPPACSCRAPCRTPSDRRWPSGSTRPSTTSTRPSATSAARSSSCAPRSGASLRTELRDAVDAAAEHARLPAHPGDVRAGGQRRARRHRPGDPRGAA